jgi:hypothetical protein
LELRTVDIKMASVDIPKEMWALLADQPLAPAPPVSCSSIRVEEMTDSLQGVTPNFEHPTWHGHSIVIAASICVPVMLAVASIRIYAKCYITRKWTRDDSKWRLRLGSCFTDHGQDIFLVSLVSTSASRART